MGCRSFAPAKPGSTDIIEVWSDTRSRATCEAIGLDLDHSSALSLEATRPNLSCKMQSEGLHQRL
jgi:hypothetical protein